MIVVVDYHGLSVHIVIEYDLLLYVFPLQILPFDVPVILFDIVVVMFPLLQNIKDLRYA